MLHSIECITKVLVICGGAKLSDCDRETNPAMGRKNPPPLTCNSLHGKGYMQYLGWLGCKVVQGKYIDTSCMYFARRVPFNWKSSII